DAAGVDGDLDRGVLGPLGDVEHAARLPEPSPHARDNGVTGLEGQARVLRVDLPGTGDRHFDAVDEPGCSRQWVAPASLLRRRKHDECSRISPETTRVRIPS